MIPLSVPNFEGNEEKYTLDAVSQGWVSTGGAYISKFEKMVAEFVGVNDAVACQSGTAAIHLALMEIGIGRGDMVLVPTLTFIAAVNPVKYCGAEPVFMDCDDSLCIDPKKIVEFCENECELRYQNGGEQGLFHKQSGKHVKALVVVHVFGNMADMVDIMDIAKKFHLKVIEDATEALGSYYASGKYKGKYAGTIGDIGAYSFNGNKIITTGGGGMVVSKNQSNLNHIRYISTQAKDDPVFYVHNEVGYNYRMTNVQAAIGVAQMEKLEEYIFRKNNNYNLYQDKIRDIGRIRLLEFAPNIYSNKWFYSLLLLDIGNITSKDVVNRLSEEGIQTRCIWGLIGEQQPYTGCISYKVEKAKYYEKRIVNLPCSTNLKIDEIERVVSILKRVLD